MYTSTVRPRRAASPMARACCRRSSTCLAQIVQQPSCEQSPGRGLDGTCSPMASKSRPGLFASHSRLDLHSAFMESPALETSECRRRATPRYPPRSAWNLHLVSRRAAVPAASAALPLACASPEVLWAPSQGRGPGAHAVAQHQVHHEKARRTASLPSRQSTRSSRSAGVAIAHGEDLLGCEHLHDLGNSLGKMHLCMSATSCSHRSKPSPSCTPSSGPSLFDPALPKPRRLAPRPRPRR